MRDLLHDPTFIDYVLGILKGLILPATVGIILLILMKLNKIPFFNEIFKGINKRFLE